MHAFKKTRTGTQNSVIEDAFVDEGIGRNMILTESMQLFLVDFPRVLNIVL